MGQRRFRDSSKRSASNAIELYTGRHYIIAAQLCLLSRLYLFTCRPQKITVGTSGDRWTLANNESNVQMALAPFESKFFDVVGDPKPDFVAYSRRSPQFVYSSLQLPDQDSIIESSVFLSSNGTWMSSFDVSASVVRSQGPRSSLRWAP